MVGPGRAESAADRGGYGAGQFSTDRKGRTTRLSRIADSAVVVTLRKDSPATAQRKICFSRAISSSLTHGSLRTAALAAVHVTACRGCMLLARGLKLFWKRAQREPELACMVTLGHLSILCKLVSSAWAAAVVHYMVHMLAPVVLETPAQAPRSMGGRRGLLVLMLVSVRYIDCGPTVSVGPAATASVARGRATLSHVAGRPCKA